MLLGYLNSERGVEIDIAVVVALGSEDEGSQPSTTVSTTELHKKRKEGRTGRRRSNQL
jgi:hypothetical protein